MVKFLEVEKCLSQEKEGLGVLNKIPADQQEINEDTEKYIDDADNLKDNIRVLHPNRNVDKDIDTPDFITGTPKIYRSNKRIKFFCSVLRIKVFVIRSFVVGVVRVRL